MIEQIQLFLKDPAKVARAATIGFFLMAAISVWYLAWLQHDLVFEGGWINSHRGAAVFAKLFTVIGLAFALCYVSIFFSQKAKKETIVYLDKKIDTSSGQQSASSGQSQDSFNISALRDKTKSGNKEERLQRGLNEFCSVCLPLR